MAIKNLMPKTGCLQLEYFLVATYRLPTKIINAYIVFSRNRDFAARNISRIRVRVGRKIGHSAKSSVQ